MPIKTAHPVFVDLLYVSLLVLYVFAGMMLAPFHGDEATTIYQSKDWYRITSLQGLPDIFYRAKIDDPRLSDEQEFRLQNGVMSKYAIGLFASAVGQPIQAMNDPWFWGADYNDNQAHGHIPKPVVLLAARFSSTLMLALSLALVFRIGWLLQRRSAAWIGSLMYTTLPAVLLNGRRAMFEGATLLGIALVIYCGLVVARHMNRESTSRRMWLCWLMLGLSCGFAIASKHSLLIVVVPILGLLLILGRAMLGRTVCGVFIAGVVAAVVFLILNPAWWSAPLTVPGEVLRLRAGILKAQVDIFGGYQNVQDRVSALARYPLGTAQYYEDKQNWMAWIGDEVTAYEASGLNGFDWTRLSIAVYLVVAFGVVSLFISRRSVDILLAGTLIFVALGIFIATPLPWQRYYLLLAPFWAVSFGVGGAVIIRAVRMRIRSER